jgi:peroxiredoxin 2/4
LLHGAGLSPGLISLPLRFTTRPQRIAEAGFLFVPVNHLSTFDELREGRTTMSTASESRIPRINEQAPDFQAKSTHGVIKLSDYTSKGKWVLLFSHPSDFTPVCTTEFIEFARRHEDFEKLNVQLIGISIDSIYSHIARVRDIEEHAGVKIHFPVIADLDTKVAQLFGLIHEGASDTSTVRAVFAIDPKQNIRAIIYYPMQLGRSVDELIRVFQGLQTVDSNSVSIPANWQPGEPVIVPAPATVADAGKRPNGGCAGLDVHTWYLSKKNLAPSASDTTEGELVGAK